ncbi:MAG: amidohydrolase family protein [Candidatus Poribacteria bacterium]|nr:amidohydrolase family protein [Candidatus Poribacteria bacterium]
MRTIDPHLHVWDTNATDEYPFAPGRAPTARGDVAFLLDLMDGAGVSGALIIQPIVYRFDHRYVSAALTLHPDRFKGMCLLDPQHNDPPAELARWKDEGYGSVRFNPGLFPEGAAMDSDLGHRMFETAGELGMPVGFLINPQHFDAVDALCESHPETVAVIDHFGHCRPGYHANPEFAKLLDLAKHPNLHVKLSEWARSSHQEYPYVDLHDFVYRLLDAYGANRLMWATDFPFIVEQCGYTEGLEVLSKHTPNLDAETMGWFLSGTAEKVFGTWNA